MAEFFLQHLTRRRPGYFCHNCQHRFGAGVGVENPTCPQCGSDFVEQDAEEEQSTTGTGERPVEVEDSLDPFPELDSNEPFFTIPLSSGTSSTSSNQQRRGEDSNTDDPEQEIIQGGPRRRTNRTGFQNRGLGMRGPFVRIHGPQGRPLAQVLHEHIEGLMNPSRTRPHSSRDHPDGSSHQEDSPPPPQRPRQNEVPTANVQSEVEGGASQAPTEESGTRGANIHFSVGLPWYVMSQQGSRGDQPNQVPNPSNPRVRRVGFPLVIGFNSGGAIHGNMGDYAWGTGGLDDIISQMLANLEDSGPPPAKAEKIQELPSVTVTEDDIVQCADCSVCKERFSIGENLLKLPCTHLYHRDCVIPWLKLHDTCPTCRYHLNTGKYETDTAQ